MSDKILVSLLPVSSKAGVSTRVASYGPTLHWISSMSLVHDRRLWQTFRSCSDILSMSDVFPVPVIPNTAMRILLFEGLEKFLWSSRVTARRWKGVDGMGRTSLTEGPEDLPRSS